MDLHVAKNFGFPSYFISFEDRTPARVTDLFISNMASMATEAHKQTAILTLLLLLGLLRPTSVIISADISNSSRDLSQSQLNCNKSVHCLSTVQNYVVPLPPHRHGHSLRKLDQRTSGPASVESYVFLRLMQAGDIQPNPGPKPLRYPCGECGKACRWGQNCIECDGCEKWHHKRCVGMGSAVFDTLANQTDPTWICPQCGIPNLTSSTFFKSEHIDSVHSTNTSSSLASLQPSGQPLATSSPRRSNRTPPKKQLRLLNVNFNGISGKVPQLHDMIDSLDPDVIIGTESKLSQHHLDSEIFPPNFIPWRKDRNADGGGIFIAVNSRVRSDIVDFDFDISCEALWVTIQISSGKKAYIGAFYRPPSDKIDTMNMWKLCMEDITRQAKDSLIIVGGDFNLPGIDWQVGRFSPPGPHRDQSELLLNILDDNNLTQMNSHPTRKGNVLDLMMTNRPNLVSNCHVGPGVSDHDGMVILDMSTSAQPNRKPPRKVWCYNSTDWNKVRDYMEHQQEAYFSRLPLEKTVEENWTFFKSSIDYCLDTLVKSKQASGNYRMPWINREIRGMRRKRKKMYDRAVKIDNNESWDAYYAQRRATDRQTNNSYYNYINSILEPALDKNSRNFYKFIKSRKKDTFGVSTLKHQGKVGNDNSTKAEILNEQFCSVFTHEDTSSLPQMPTSPHPDMPRINITSHGVEKILKRINVSKATGPDGVPGRLLKEVAGEIAPVLASLFQQALDTSQNPLDWKKANVMPVFKKGNRAKPENYRPVSLTAICSKLLEHIVVSNILDHLDAHDILVDNQHGFRSKRSCETQLLITCQDLANNLNSHIQTDAIVLDFAKAFDKVPHQRLNLKLQHYGIRGCLADWIKDLLTDRKQQVVVDGASSSSSEVLSGVPQGTVIGPLLFLIYINDIVRDISSSTSVRLFADDCLMYRQIKSTEDQHQLQADLDQLQHWADTWLMHFNVKKCFSMHVSLSNRKRTFSYQMKGETLVNATSTTYLGVTIHQKLTWSPHIDSICAKANRVLGFVRRNLRGTPTPVKEKAYTTLVRPILEYAAPIWDPHQTGDIQRLEAVQRRAARFVLNKPHYHPEYRTASVTNMLHQLEWPTLLQRRQQSKVTLLFKVQNNLVAVPAEYHAQPSNPRALLRCPHRLVVPRSEIELHRASFLPSATRLYNTLPNDIGSAASIDAFKALVVQHFH